ncbi:MAG: DUF5020 family protein [Tannerellaceae bacterium]|jgi:hypothetical protein|nr:DUF5020 family protein [Tannerellaceae bacterium]
MKHFLALIVLIPVVFCGKAQNVQLHYDFGSALYSNDYGARPKLTTTVEMFKPDGWGSSFFFIDMDYTGEGISGAYWEIARELRFGKTPFSLHLEYNGGLTSSFPFQHAYLGGATYTYDDADFRKGFSVSLLYKHIRKHTEPHNFQLTGTWYLHFGNKDVCTFSGFADWWREKTPVGTFIFMAEPQLWLNLNKLKGIDKAFNLSIGSETELTHNFAMHGGFYAIPTLAIKWTFD